eukprot:5708914-Amphidinium_carterae.2
MQLHRLVYKPQMSAVKHEHFVQNNTALGFIPELCLETLDSRPLNTKNAGDGNLKIVLVLGDSPSCLNSREA